MSTHIYIPFMRTSHLTRSLPITHNVFEPFFSQHTTPTNNSSESSTVLVIISSYNPIPRCIVKSQRPQQKTSKFAITTN